jgi:K+-sensing histidine kinase KdpD
MGDDSDRLMYTGLGPLAALALGMLLVPVRGYTTASNLTFLFLALTIVVAESGGRRAAVATALTAALSLDFFLTQPYLRLEIADKHDIIAFLGLTVCGLVAAGLGARRGERASDLRAVRRHRDLLHWALMESEAGGALDYRATMVLNACRSVLPLSAMVLRDGANQVVAASPAARPAPETVLRQGDLLPVDGSDPDRHPRGLPMAPEGGRLALTVAGRQVGWLDVWGSRAPASAEGRRALADVARVLAAMLVRRDMSAS